ncbi:hypothetical protein NXS19_011153 [Fusarium pseudograminearum]|nr:hypothetical protein NXS19_011153 [Fusarium pseudograminearum]
MSSQDYSDLGHVPYWPEDTETVNPSDLWNTTPINNSFDPQQLNTTPPPDEVDQSHATDTYESFNDAIPPRPGKRLSLISVRILNKWLSAHMHHPYPTVAEVEKKFQRPDTLDYSSASSEASPRDIPLPRPPTPTIQQTPFERWRSSPPEDEPLGLDAIARAVTGVSHPPAGGSHVQTRNAPSVTGSWATSAETSDSSRSSNGHRFDGSIRSTRNVNKKRRRARRHGRGYGTMQLSQECHRFQCTFCTESFKLKRNWTRHEKTQHLSLEQWVCTPAGPTILNERSEKVCVYCGALIGREIGGLMRPRLTWSRILCLRTLLTDERNSPLPFTTSQGAPYSSTSAFELLQLELDYFYSNYVDTNHNIPSDETLHTEACSVIFGAEMSSSTPQAASSWLRDLIMGTEHITAKARMAPLKSAARSRFTELRIHSKKDIFDKCNLEDFLRPHVDMLKTLNLEIDDDELQREACSIVSHMSDASPIFTNLLIALINGSTKWLVPFRLRTGLPIVETEINLQVDGRETENRDATPLDLDILQQILSEEADRNTLGHPTLGFSPASSNQKVVSLNDGNMYRGLTRDLTRYVARTISPLNPTSHVPTDEELQYQARWIMYDSHDVWNQTPADNMAWLEEFKKESGLF